MPSMPRAGARATPSTLSVGWESIVYIKRRKKAAAHKTRPSMPRAGASARVGLRATRAGQRAARCETEAQTSNCEWPANGPAPRRLLISDSRLLISAAFKRGKIPPVTRHHQAVTEVHNFTFSLAAVSAGSPPVVRRLFEVNSEPHTGHVPRSACVWG